SGGGAGRGGSFLTTNLGPVVASLTAPSPINENNTATVSGTISDPDALDTHTVVITWGPGEGSTTLNLPAGVLSFGASHQYLDDDPTGTTAHAYPISLTVTDNHGASRTAAH